MVGAGLFTAAIVPLVRRLGLRWGLIDQPDPRKQHNEPMVRLGGIGIVLGFCLALFAALAGACLGFLRDNFNPARIFMGDGGSYFLGFSLAAISLVGPAKELTTVSLLLPLLILSLPLADMSAVIMGRVSSGRSPFYPDRRHLHHRLLRAGFSHRRTVVLIYAFTQWFAAIALVAANAELRFLWLALATGVLIWVVVRSHRSQGEEPLDQGE
ncbi:MAG: hypothetical protein EB094_09000 [Synechococcaceae bacterium WBA_3_309]|nr:hypothetical protein [Synechococcaceae bacterium WBA_3_309]